jgi:serine/threonine protein phosphatase 1
MAGPIYFAIGDVHGQADKLRRLHDAILQRIDFERRAAKIVHVGDYIDRGPDSRGVIDQIMALERRFDRDPAVEVVSLMGNHEQMLLEAYSGDADDEHSWLTQGGFETLESYSEDPVTEARGWRRLVPEEHLAWLTRRPLLLHDPGRKLVFVHAGIEPATFPGEDEEVYLWTRSDRFFNDDAWPDREELKDLLVVHGHTPKSFEPEIYPRRINIDTGAVFGGPLTAVMLKEGEAPQFLRAD